MPRAMLISTSCVARQVLEAAGWEILDDSRPAPSTLRDARAIDLWVVGLDASRFTEGLRLIQALKAHAPTLRMVVIAPFFRTAGQCMTDVLVDVPIIRCGFERELLCSAVAAA